MREEAFKRIGHLYPKVDLPKEYGGGEATVIAWIWTRRVKCPNPVCGVQTPLARSFSLATKKGKEAWVEPKLVQSHQKPKIEFEVKAGKGSPTKGTVNRQGASCICCLTPIPISYIRTEGKAGNMDSQLMAIVCEGDRRRIYLDPSLQCLDFISDIKIDWKPEVELPDSPRYISPPLYGMKQHYELFTPRQLSALATFSELLSETRIHLIDELKENQSSDRPAQFVSEKCLEDYASAVITYLAFGLSRLLDLSSTICLWSSNPAHELVTHMFTKQAIPMTWDFGEINPFCQATSWSKCLEFVPKVLEKLNDSVAGAEVSQLDITTAGEPNSKFFMSTDPPYYDSIGYADLSDFFYVWLRHSLSSYYPSLFETLLTPKASEIVVNPYRHGGSKQDAKVFFEESLKKTFFWMRNSSVDHYPVTVFYAVKQSEADNKEEKSTGNPTSIDLLQIKLPQLS
jgi:putative DNA methylase